MSEQVKIQIRFSVDTAYGQYNDALYFTQEDYATKTQAEIDALKQQRVDNWIYNITHPVPYVEPTAKQLTDYRIELLNQVQEVENKLVDKLTAEEITTLKTEYQTKIDSLQVKIDTKPKVIGVE